MFLPPRFLIQRSVLAPDKVLHREMLDRGRKRWVRRGILGGGKELAQAFLEPGIEGVFGKGRLGDRFGRKRSGDKGGRRGL